MVKRGADPTPILLTLFDFTRMLCDFSYENAKKHILQVIWGSGARENASGDRSRQNLKSFDQKFEKTFRNIQKAS